MRHPKDCEGDFDKIEPLKIFGSSTSSGWKKILHVLILNIVYFVFVSCALITRTSGRHVFIYLLLYFSDPFLLLNKRINHSIREEKKKTAKKKKKKIPLRGFSLRLFTRYAVTRFYWQPATRTICCSICKFWKTERSQMAAYTFSFTGNFCFKEGWVILSSNTTNHQGIGRIGTSQNRFLWFKSTRRMPSTEVLVLQT